MKKKFIIAASSSVRGPIPSLLTGNRMRKPRSAVARASAMRRRLRGLFRVNCITTVEQLRNTPREERAAWPNCGAAALAEMDRLLNEDVKQLVELMNIYALEPGTKWTWQSA